MTRIKAGLSHFIISLIVFSLVVLVLLYFWYPQPHFIASGGWQGLRITASVDLVLGPLLTFVVFNAKKSKKVLAKDLSVIATLQLIALVWGVNTIYYQRPVALVFWENTFISVPALAFTSQGYDTDDLEEFSEGYPKLIYAEAPVILAKITQMISLVENDQIPPHHQPELFRPFKDKFVELGSMQVDINEVISINAVMNADLMAILTKNNTQIEDYQYYSLRSKFKNIIMLFSHEGEIQDYILVP
jgi:hypothetical protein